MPLTPKRMKERRIESNNRYIQIAEECMGDTGRVSKDEVDEIYIQEILSKVTQAELKACYRKFAISDASDAVRRETKKHVATGLVYRYLGKCQDREGNWIIVDMQYGPVREVNKCLAIMEGNWQAAKRLCDDTKEVVNYERRIAGRKPFVS